MAISVPGAMAGSELAALSIPAELAVKPAPVTVRVKAAPPGAAALGLRLAREAAGVVEMDSASTLEVRGPVLETVILAVPGAAIKAADTCAVNCVALTPVVGSATPFHATVASERKLLPLTVSVKSGPPTNTDAGLRLVMAGVAAFTVKMGAWGETSEPGLTTWMTCDPAFAMAPGGTLTVSWFTLT